MPAGEPRYQGRRSEERGPQAIDPDLGPPGARSEYDLVHVRARPWRGRPCSATLLGSDFEFLGLNLGLDTARARRRALDRHGITVHIVPVRYREASMEPAEGGRRAGLLAALPGPVRLLAEHPMFSFYAAGGSPEGTTTRGLAVDRCDGHVWTDAEMAAYFNLIGRR